MMALLNMNEDSVMGIFMGGGDTQNLLAFKKIELCPLSGGRDAKTHASPSTSVAPAASTKQSWQYW